MCRLHLEMIKLYHHKINWQDKQMKLNDMVLGTITLEEGGNKTNKRCQIISVQVSIYTTQASQHK